MTSIFGRFWVENRAVNYKSKHCSEADCGREGRKNFVIRNFIHILLFEIVQKIGFFASFCENIQF